jgi:hypothetical protein
VNRYQHLIEACGDDHGKLAELALLLTGCRIADLLVESDGDVNARREHKRQFQERLADTRTAIDEIARRIQRSMVP